MESDIVPQAKGLRDRNLQLLTLGEQDLGAYLSAQRDYNDVVRQYRDVMLRHRRAMLKLNTAVGLRLLP